MAVNIEIGADFRTFFEKLKDAEDKIQNVGKGLMLVGAGLTAGLTAPMIALASKAVAASGELTALSEDLTKLKEEALAGLGREIVKTFNLKENMEKLKGFVERLITAFKNLNPQVKKFALIAAAVLASLGPVVAALGAIVYIAPYVGAAWALITSPVSIAIGLFVALAAAQVYLKDNLLPLAQTFYNVWGSIKNTVLGAIQSILQKVQDLGKLVGKDLGLDEFIKKLEGDKIEPFKNIKWGSFKDALKNQFAGLNLFTGTEVFKLDSAENIEGAKKSVRTIYQAIGTELKTKGAIQPFADWTINVGEVIKKGLDMAIVVPMLQVVSKAEQIIIDFNQALGDLVRSSAAGFATAIGEGLGALANGGTLKDFGKGLLITVADFVSQLGKLIIGYAIAMSGLEAAISNPGMWPVALAAGIALVAIGSAISGALSKGLDGGGGGSYSGGGGNYGGVSYNSQPLVLETRIEGRELILVQKRTNSFTR